MDFLTQGYMAWQAFSRDHGSWSQRLAAAGSRRVSTLSSNITGNKSRLSSMRISLVTFVHSA